MLNSLHLHKKQQNYLHNCHKRSVKFIVGCRISIKCWCAALDEDKSIHSFQTACKQVVINWEGAAVLLKRDCSFNSRFYFCTAYFLLYILDSKYKYLIQFPEITAISVSITLVCTQPQSIDFVNWGLKAPHLAKIVLPDFYCYHVILLDLKKN